MTLNAPTGATSADRVKRLCVCQWWDRPAGSRPAASTIDQRRPCEPANVIPLPTGRVERRDRLGGVLREYSRAAA